MWEKVISLIGYFDLDPNRALDIILDVLSVHLTTHYTFFIALLSFSPWSGFYRRPTSDYDGTPMVVDLPPGSFRGKSLDEILALSDRKARDALTAPATHGPRVLAQVLGFKFTYYQVSHLIFRTPPSSHHHCIVCRGRRSDSEEPLSYRRNLNPTRLHHIGRLVPSCASLNASAVCSPSWLSCNSRFRLTTTTWTKFTRSTWQM